MSYCGEASNCPHVLAVGNNSWEDVLKKKQAAEKCDSCDADGPNLWICLHSECLYVGCGESAEDHSTLHSQKRGKIQTEKHSLTLNMTTMRIWCYECECEVYKDNNNPPLLMRDRNVSVTAMRNLEHSHRSFMVEETESEDEDDHNLRPRGLTGLQNIGNTCYMNGALQALSNCPPLTRFFLDCSGYISSEARPMLSRNYMKLVQELWHKKRASYLIPSSIAQGIKAVHPMFRGYTQQDTQEFLRCFMDQLHEELKYPQITEPLTTDVHREDSDEQNDSMAGQEDATSEYETCEDSAKSSEQSLVETSDESSPNSSPDSLKKEKNSEKDSDSGVSSIVQTKNKNKKNIKDTANQATLKQKSTQNSEEQCNDTLNESFSDVTISRTRSASGAKNKSFGKALQKSPSAPAAAGEMQITPKAAVKKKKQVEYSSIISDIFDGKILSSVQCLTCERVSSTKENFQDLSLPIPNKDHIHMLHANTQIHKGSCSEVALKQGWMSWMYDWMKSWLWGPKITLNDCLAAFFSQDELKGDNMYSCDKCKKLRNGVKFSKVMALPEILCIHLKRFRHEFMFSSKISSYVEFPTEGLDMSPYLHKDCKNQVSTYDLIAVIMHHGTAGGGHYTANALNHLNEQWYEFDDQYVTEIDIQQVENCEAYVLFYRKKNDHMLAHRLKAQEILDSPDSSDSFMKFYISRQWINKFNTFAEPGEINNRDFLCKHGGVHPHRWAIVDDLAEHIPQKLWTYLHDRFGGGPAVNHLYQCDTCQVEMDALKHRQKVEMDRFVQLHDNFKREENPMSIYAISMPWFKEWESFVKARIDEPPGPIDNSKIALVKNNVASVRHSSDYGQLSEDMWDFLFGVYGGGPPVVLKQQVGMAAVENSKEVGGGDAGEDDY